MDNEEQRDHAEEAYNRALMRDEDERYDRAAISEAADRNAEEMRREIGTREGDALIAEAAQSRTDHERWRDRGEPTDAPEALPRTAAATAARIRGRLDRQAEELRAAGFLVVGPEGADDAAGYLPRGIWPDVDKARGLERHEFGDVLDVCPECGGTPRGYHTRMCSASNNSVTP
jgi:hypothetical protein